MYFHISFFFLKRSAAPFPPLPKKFWSLLADKFESDIQRIIQGVLDDLDPSTFL